MARNVGRGLRMRLARITWVDREGDISRVRVGSRSQVGRVVYKEL